MNSAVADKVIAMISPTFGDFIATAKVTAACRLAKLDVTKLAVGELPAFAEKLTLVCENLGPTVTAALKARVLAI